VNQSNKRARPQPQPARRPAQRPSGAVNPSARPAARPSARPSAARPAARPSARPAAKGSALPGGFTTLAIIGVIAIAIGFALQCVWPNGFPLNQAKDANAAAEVVKISEIHSSGPIRINEIMASNSNTLSLQDGTTPDWVEIANVSGKTVNLSGYSLSKSTNSASVFVFPDMSLNAGECVLVYADSRLRDDATADLHAPFRIGASGDTLMLFNSADTAIDTVNIPAMGKDQAYARADVSAWTVTSQATPWMENSEASYRKLHEKAADSPVIISEVMASNSETRVGDAGAIYDYIELYNRSSAAVSLSGWYLSDDKANTRKWSMPDVTIGPGEYLIVFASGLDQKDPAEALHTSFSLSSEGECAALSNNHGQLMDIVEYDVLKSDQALSLMGDGSWSVSAKATPGMANQ